MPGLGRNVGIVGFVLSVGVACTQLFGGDRQNTLATPPAKVPAFTTPALLPMGAALEICTTAQMRCEGALLQTCADDRTSWVTAQRCAAAELCQSNPALCLAATCGADEMTCSGSVLQKCNSTRTGWDVFATCLSPAHCNADERQCRSEPCNPGDRRCDRSETDQSPVLEVCRDDRMDWGPLDACVTRELCDQTLTSGVAGGLMLGSDGMVQIQAPSTPQTVSTCLLPACAVGEVRCEGARLEFCSEGRTGWITAEECASPALCAGALTNVGTSGTPVCLTPVCATGQHQCTDAGVLQVCSEDRTGFRDLETCIGPPFCNAVLADQGQAGCRDAPCEAGQMQCNGAQLQVCRDDRTGLDDVGAPCESAALCNADDPSNAFCDEPVCRRGATSGNEFHCEGAELQRCNESLTVYDTIQTCATAALCDASQRANGCRPPVCQPGGHACNGGFLQTCNADQTGFDNTENCGSQAQCDANAGRCADPCEPGATRCNSATGDLELCRDRLTGWQPIADCQSLALCDEANGRCNICFGGAFSCADNQLRQCAADGRTFSRQNIPAECAAAPGGGAGVRACQNNQVVVNPCQFGCTNGRCNECAGTTTQCVGNGQIRRCVNGFFGPPTSCSDGNACNGVESCQNNNCVGGQAPNCNDGNACTNDTCNPAVGCQFPAVGNRTTCDPPSGTLEICSNGARQVTACGQLGCAPGSTICNNCGGAGQCNGNQFTPCNNGRFGAPVNCDDGNQCTDDSCNGNGCQHGAVPNRAQCVNGDIQSCNNGNFGNQDCGANSCNAGSTTCNNCNAGQCNGNQFTPCNNGRLGAPVNCDDGNQCTNDSCNANGCQHGAVPNRAQCVNGDIQSCNNGNLGNQDCGANGCNAGSTSCNACAANTAPSCVNGQRRTCVNGQFQNANCPGGQICQGGACVNACTPNAFVSCASATTANTCNAAGTGFAVTTCNPNATPFCDDDRGCVRCRFAADCGTNPPACRVFTCSAAGACGTAPAAPNTLCQNTDFCGGNAPDTCDAAGVCRNNGTPVSCVAQQQCVAPSTPVNVANGCQCPAPQPAVQGTACTTAGGLRGTCNGVTAGNAGCNQLFF